MEKTENQKEVFAGDKKSGKWLLQRQEDKFKSFFNSICSEIYRNLSLNTTDDIVERGNNLFWLFSSK